MPRISRRRLGSLVGSSALGLALAPLLARRARAAENPWGRFGPLEPQYPLNMAELPLALRDTAFISLPRDFHYSVISAVGQTMSDGMPVPGAHDGMAAFGGEFGSTWLVRNHEIGFGSGVIAPSHATYDPAVGGGTTTLLVSRRGRLVKHFGSLGGTERNCAGGRTPWGSWLTCEETFSTHDGVRHGYVFEVPAQGHGDPMPLEGLGRFNHEAAAVDPFSSFVYLTEDRGDSLLYRFRPKQRGNLRGAGQLEALRLRDFAAGADTRSNFQQYLHRDLAVAWVPIDDFDPDSDSTRLEGRSKGAALFARGEGCLYARGRIYFSCTSGGDMGLGQIFAYDPRDDRLRLWLESTDAEVLDYPDNLALGPGGQLYICEDGSAGNGIVSVDRAGQVSTVVRNIHSSSEFCGVCFAPDGHLMFANIQRSGITLVIRGPFDQV